MDKEKILKGIAEFREEQNEIIEAIRKADGRLSTSEFDKVFGDVVYETLPSGETIVIRKEPKLRFMGSKSETFIMGSLQQPGDWAKYLQLTQLMVGADILEIETKDGDIFYREKK